ncbi:TPA: hypothetical protein VO310_000451 [Streptococcus pyogenes]|nr:hypothetical protein [Streptococcus pyogenes]
MKTKSKRFLNLATLCLALLGTTLLMTQPVKAGESGAAYVSDYEGPYYEGWHNANDSVTEGQDNLEGSSDDSNDSKGLESQVDSENPMDMSKLSILDLVYGMVKDFWGYMLDVLTGNAK